jgi:hypothetical protein
MSRRFLIITGFLSFAALFVQWGFTGFLWLISGILQILVCALLAATIIITLGKRWDQSFWYHYVRSILVFTSVLWVFSSILLVFMAYQYAFPASVGKIILSNGERNIVFFQMSHIATPDFYREVQSDLQFLTASGYTVYTEWVTPGSPESQVRFDELMWVKMTDTLYSSLADLLGLVAQDDSIYSWLPEGSVENVDISLDTVVQLIGTGAIPQSVDPVDLEKELALFQESGQGPLFAPFMRSMLSYFLRNEGNIDSMMSGFSPEVFDTILYDRNAYIAERFFSDTRRDIALVYGALHFQWIYDILQSRDSRWDIISVERMYPYSY